MKNKTIAFVLSTLLLASPITVFAAPSEVEASEETLISEEETTEEEATEDTDADALLGEDDADTEEVYDDYTPITTTIHDEVNTVQLSIHCVMPEYFTLGVRMRIVNTDMDKMYEITATNANKYFGKLYIPAGNYTVASVMVDGDITNRYPMEYPEDFSVEDDSNHSIETTLVNFDEIQKEAYERMGLDENGNEIAEVEEDEVPVEEPEEKSSNELPWRIVTHEGTGEGKVSFAGTTDGVYNIVVEITSTGKGKEAEYHYSTDGGENWSDVMVVDSGKDLETQSGHEIGFSINFDSNKEYIQGDRYTYDSEHEYETKIESRNGTGSIRLTSDGVVYGGKMKVNVTITKTGANGEAEFRCDINGKKTEGVVPADGFYSIPDTNMKITFFAGEDKFVVGDSWNSEFKGEPEERDYTVYIVVGIGGLMALVFLVYSYYGSKKDKVSDFKIMPYQRVKVENVPDKKKKRKKAKGKKNRDDVTGNEEESNE